MVEKVKLEVYIARPPTSKCREVVAVMEEVLQRYPDQVRLIVFERGAPWPEEPSGVLRFAIQKANTVPMCFAGGKLVVGGGVPSVDEVEEQVKYALGQRQG